jgi:hypothetical protein
MMSRPGHIEVTPKNITRWDLKLKMQTTAGTTFILNEGRILDRGQTQILTLTLFEHIFRSFNLLVALAV